MSSDSDDECGCSSIMKMEKITFLCFLKEQCYIVQKGLFVFVC